MVAEKWKYFTFLTDVRDFSATFMAALVNDIFVAFQDHTNIEIIKPFTETFKCMRSELALYRCNAQDEDVALMWSQITEESQVSPRINQTEMLSRNNILVVKC